METFRNQKEFATSLGITDRTLRRKLTAANITLPKGLLSPETQQMIRKALGFNE
jgi:transcriptional antiterminator